MNDVDSDCVLKIRGLTIGKEVQERVKTGSIDEDRVATFEKEQLRTLECMDQAHTKLYGLTFQEADRYISKFNEFTREAPTPSCQVEQNKVFVCLQKHRGDGLKCADDVRAFANCVDASLARAVCGNAQPDPHDGSSKKISYAEKFRRIAA